MKLKFSTILLAALALTAVSSRAFAQKVQVCHKTGNGDFHLITIDINALPAHTSHGDGTPGDPIPDNPGFFFGPNCTPTVAPPSELPIGCYTLFGLDVLYMGPIDTLGNLTVFSGSHDGTCSGKGVFDPAVGIIAADNATDALNKCTALVGAQASIADLGNPAVFQPIKPGFWFCTTS